MKTLTLAQSFELELAFCESDDDFSAVHAVMEAESVHTVHGLTSVEYNFEDGSDLTVGAFGLTASSEDASCLNPILRSVATHVRLTTGMTPYAATMKADKLLRAGTDAEIDELLAAAASSATLSQILGVRV